jgi:hypothetical protein
MTRTSTATLYHTLPSATAIIHITQQHISLLASRYHNLCHPQLSPLLRPPACTFLLPSPAYKCTDNHPHPQPQQRTLCDPTGTSYSRRSSFYAAPRHRPCESRTQKSHRECCCQIGAQRRLQGYRTWLRPLQGCCRVSYLYTFLPTNLHSTEIRAKWWWYTYLS